MHDIAKISGTGFGRQHLRGNDKDQNPETQLLPLREYVQRTGDTAVEYVDLASATDLPHRTPNGKCWRMPGYAKYRREVDHDPLGYTRKCKGHI